MKALTFQGAGASLAAHLHVEGVTSGRRPGVVVVGSWLTVKEQMAAVYAARMAAAGYAALTFDFRGFGASEGAPREVESGRSKAQDILDAAAFLATRPEVDPDRIGVLAVCASAHYTALALQGAQTFGPGTVKSVVMVAPWLHDQALVEQLYGGRAAVKQRLESASRARARYVTTSEVEYIAAASATDQGAAMYMEGDALDYYLNRQRGAVPEWGARFATMAWTEWLTMDSPSLAPRFGAPLRIVTSEHSATPEGTKRFVKGLVCPHDVVWGPADALSQFHFYDDPATVRFASARAIEHFGSTM
jgi:dienelactone hydrolase